VVLEALIETDVLVQVKVNSALRVERSAKLDSALKLLGCATRVEKTAQSVSRI
jgi:hypothetical protein